MESKTITLPANDAVQNWFEENIDKECSASSAIYKFRLWLESLSVKQTGPRWAKASEFKTDKSVFRPYRRKSVHEGVDYDFGEIFIDLCEDDGLLYLDIDSENDYLPQSDTRWVEFEILDESAGESDAVEFAEWLYENRWFNKEGDLWCYTFEQGTRISDAAYKKNYMKTTAELYTIFKQQKEK